MFGPSSPVFSSRHLTAHAATLATTWTDGSGEPGPATGAVTCTVTDHAGAVVSTGAATLTAGRYTFPLAASLLPSVTWLSATWTDTANVSQATNHEVVGAVYAPLATLRSLEPSLVSWSDAEVLAARTVAEIEAERCTNQSWVPRFGRCTAMSNTGTLSLPWYPVRSLIAARNAWGVALDLLTAEVTVNAGGWLGRCDGWSLGPYEVDLTHGHDGPNADVLRAVARRTAYWCRQSSTPTADQQARLVIEGGQTIQLSSPGRNRTGDDITDAIYRSNRHEPIGVA